MKEKIENRLKTSGAIIMLILVAPFVMALVALLILMFLVGGFIELITDEDIVSQLFNIKEDETNN